MEKEQSKETSVEAVLEVELNEPNGLDKNVSENKYSAEATAELDATIEVEATFSSGGKISKSESKDSKSSTKSPTSAQLKQNESAPKQNEIQKYSSSCESNDFMERVKEAIKCAEEHIEILIHAIQEHLSCLPSPEEIKTFLEDITINNKFIRLYLQNHSLCIQCAPKRQINNGCTAGLSSGNFGNSGGCNICTSNKIPTNNNCNASSNSRGPSCEKCSWCS